MLTTSVKGRALDYNRVVGGRQFRGINYAAEGLDDDVFVLIRETYHSNILKVNIGQTIDDEEVVMSFSDKSEMDFKHSWPTCAVFNGVNLLVTDELQNVVSVFSPDGKLLDTIGNLGTGEAEFNRPSGIAIDSAKNIYVADTLNHRIQKLSDAGSFIQSWGEFGDTEGFLNSPWGICIDKDDFVYIADHKNHRIQKFSPDGKFIISFGNVGTRTETLNHPADVAVDDSGDIYVADWVNNRIQIFDSNGIYLASLTGSAVALSKWQEQYVKASPDVYKARRRVRTLEPETLFALPTCVSFDSSKSRLLAVDSQRWRIQIFDKVSNYSDPQFNI
ncbi:NHL repeat-containing protein [Chloroflexi bacterium]|nr:NHL repeat-containing protein [Chloroflexota bacterium]